MPCDSTEQKQKQSRHVQSHQLDHVNHPSRPNSIAQMASVAVTSIAPQQHKERGRERKTDKSEFYAEAWCLCRKDKLISKAELLSQKPNGVF